MMYDLLTFPSAPSNWSLTNATTSTKEDSTYTIVEATPGHPEKITVFIKMPGYSKQDINVTLEAHVLYVYAKSAIDFIGTYSNQIILKKYKDWECLSADYCNGVMKLSLEAKVNTKKITIN